MNPWRPFAGFQEDFCSRGEFEVLAGGAAGPGKTDCLVNMALRHIDHPSYKALLLRRIFPELQEIMDRCWEQYPAFGAFYRSKTDTWRFPSGAQIRLGHMQHEDDKRRYHGGEFQFVGFDELTEFTGTQYLYIFSRMRSARDSSIPSQIRATTNPGGPGHVWVKERFVDVIRPGHTYVDPKTGLSRAFIPGRVKDNVALMANDPGYITRLEAMDEIDKQRYLHGNWDIFTGQYFGNLNKRMHGCEPFDIPPEWERFMAFDWGYAKPFCALWFAIDYDGVLYLYRELYGCKEGQRDEGLRMIAHEVAEMILQAEDGENVRIRLADPSMFKKRPAFRAKEARGPVIADDFTSAGVNFMKGDDNRIQGWQQVHKRLALDTEVDETTGEIISQLPRIQIFNDCHAFWRTVPDLLHDEKNPEDLGTKQEDHIADTFRYACMWRPIRPKKIDIAPEGSIARERERLKRARRMARNKGISLQAAYQRVR